MTSLGFVDDVVLITTAMNHHELSTKVQALANKQIAWAAEHGAIFDAQKSKWMVFQPSSTQVEVTIDFGDRKELRPVPDTKWLGVTLDSKLSFKRHRDDVIAKGKKQANFLTSLSNTRWGIPPRLFKILMTATVHAATDYAVAAWLPLPVPKFFAEKMSSIDTICATKALGALKNSHTLFLKHYLDLTPPEIRLTAKLLNMIAIIAAKPPTQPLFCFYRQARDIKPHAHKGPLHSFFQSEHAKHFEHFLDIQ